MVSRLSKVSNSWPRRSSCLLAGPAQRGCAALCGITIKVPRATARLSHQHITSGSKVPPAEMCAPDVIRPDLASDIYHAKTILSLSDHPAHSHQPFHFYAKINARN